MIIILKEKMKVIGKRGLYKGVKSFERIAWLLKFAGEFRKDKRFVPKGVYCFKTFEEKNKWNYQMLLSKKPDLQQ